MFSLSPLTRVFVYSVPADMRRQFDGLSALVKHVMVRDVLAGDYFVFFNRKCTLCKALRWEGDGFSIWAKRLESGRFQLPASNGDSLARGRCDHLVVDSQWHRSADRAAPQAIHHTAEWRGASADELIERFAFNSLDGVPDSLTRMIRASA